MATEDTRTQRSKPSRSRKPFDLSTKRRKLSHSVPLAPIERAVNSSADSSDDDEDDKPLVHRRAFIQRILQSHQSQAAPPQPAAPTVAPCSAAQNDDDDDDQHLDTPQPKEDQQPQNDIENSQDSNTRVEHMDSLEERGEAALDRFVRFVDDLLEHDMDEDQQKRDAFDGKDKSELVCLQVTTMHKFTTLALRASYYSVFDSMDPSRLARIFQMMENSCIRAMDIDVIGDYCKRLEEHVTDFSATTKLLELVSNGLEAAVMMLDILAGCNVDRKHLPESMVMTCLQLARNHLETTIYPLIDLNAFEEDTTSLNNGTRMFLKFAETDLTAKRYMIRILPLITRLLHRATMLLEADGFDDHGVIVLGYIALGAFFHDYTDNNHSCLVTSKSGDTIVNPFEQMKLGAMDVLRILFNKFPYHRKWILSEILTSLNALTSMDRSAKRYRLTDNTKIHVMSALFMQLVQCCTISGDMEDHKQWVRKWTMKYQKAHKESDRSQIQDLYGKLVQQSMGYWQSAMEAAIDSASYLLNFVIQKCKSRTKDSYSIAEYRGILESTLQDFITVLNKPEWPAAELLLQAFSELMIERIKGTKSDLYLKSLAIEWLGILASRIKMGSNKITGKGGYMSPEWICDLYERIPGEINVDTQPSKIQLLFECQTRVLKSIAYLQVSGSALQFQICAWGKQYASSWKLIKQQSQEDQDNDTSAELLSTLQGMVTQLWCRSLDVQLGEEHEFQRSCNFEFPEMNTSDIELISELLASRNTLYKSYNGLLAEIVTCLHKDVVTYRNKAVRAIRHLVREVPEVLDDTRIRNAILQRIHDASPSIRDIAVEVLAMYLGRQTEVPHKLYEIASARVMDTAANVRKRVVKLLRDLYYKCSDPDVKVDIASKLIHRLSDNEVSICDLAFKCTQEVLFGPFRSIDQDGNDYFGSSYAHAPKARKRRIDELTGIILGAVSRLEATVGDKSTALPQIVQKCMEQGDAKSKKTYEKYFQWIVDCLFDLVLQYDEQDDLKQFRNCLLAIHAFTTTCPELLRETQASALQPYLSVTNLDDWPTARHVLNIYRDVLPQQKYHDPESIALLERILFQLVGTCPQEYTDSAVSCLCTIVQSISHRYGILVRILGSCIVKLQGIQTKVKQSGALDRPASGVMKILAICGVLCQNVDFDAKRAENPEQMSTLDKITKESLVSHVFDLLYWFTGDHGLMETAQIQRAALQGLGYMYTRYPMLMTKDASTQLMDQIFERDNQDLQTQLMIVFREFLDTEEARLEQREQDAGESLYHKDIDIETLLGNTAEFAELGVNGSIMQRYLTRIVQCAMSDSSDLRHAAFEVVAAIIHQSLAHPVLCMPIIVAAETSPDSIMRMRAYYLHRFAHDKYGMLLYSQLPKYLLRAFEYQKLLFGERVHGYGKRGGDAKMDALLGLTYTVVKQVAKPKLDFISALVRPFRFEVRDMAGTEIDIHYLRFIADNMTTLDFTQSDEVLYLLYQIERIQTTFCADLLVRLQSQKNNDDHVESEETSEPPMSHDAAAKSAIAMYILLRTKQLIKDLYEISDTDIRDFDPNEKRKPHAVTRDLEQHDPVVLWEDELLFFRKNDLTHAAAAQALSKFEDLASGTLGMLDEIEA